MEIYGSVSNQSSVSTYGSVTFQSSVKLVMEIYGSVSEAGELGLSEFVNDHSNSYPCVCHNVAPIKIGARIF